MCFFAQIPLLALHARFAAKVTWTAISEIRSHFRITIKAWSIILWTPDCGNTSLGKHQTKLCSAKCRLDRTLFQNTYPSRWFNNTYQGAKGLLDQGPFWSIIQVVYSCLGSLWPRTLLVNNPGGSLVLRVSLTKDPFGQNHHLMDFTLYAEMDACGDFAEIFCSIDEEHHFEEITQGTYVPIT